MSGTNELAWQELQRRLRAFISRRVGPDEADDVVQEVLLRIHRRIDSLDQADRLDAWAYQLTRNVIIDHYRTRARQPATASTDAAPHAESARAAITQAEDPESEVVGRELASCLIPLVERLAQPYRQAAQLVELEGVSQVDAATRLGLSTSGMKSRVQRARRLLKALLLDCCHVELGRRSSVIDYDRHGGQCAACGPEVGGSCSCS